MKPRPYAAEANLEGSLGFCSIPSLDAGVMTPLVPFGLAVEADMSSRTLCTSWTSAEVEPMTDFSRYVVFRLSITRSSVSTRATSCPLRRFVGRVVIATSTGQEEGIGEVSELVEVAETEGRGCCNLGSDSTVEAEDVVVRFRFCLPEKVDNPVKVLAHFIVSVPKEELDSSLENGEAGDPVSFSPDTGI
jgi:hypothetical protein